MSYQPPYTLNTRILELYGSVTELMGQFKGNNILDVHPRLRRENYIKSITSTCAIEGNTLSESLVSDLIDHKKVLGPPREIVEIKNALALYNAKDSLNYRSLKDHLKAHHILMSGLIEDAGHFRKTGVGVFKGKRVIHMAPPAARVRILMDDLFDWVKRETSINNLIKSAIFHCEFETIHPFSDGNGRMGRFWQNLMLIEFHPIFRSVPVESIIYRYQQDYYKALHLSQTAGDCTPFIEFSLFTIVTALKKVLEDMDHKDSSHVRLHAFTQTFKGKTICRADYMTYFKGIASATASKDLREGVEKKLLKKYGDKRTTTYKVL